MISVSYYLQCPPDGHFVRRDEWCAKECGGWENGKCKHGGTKWAIIPEADHAATQAALAAAGEALEAWDEIRAKTQMPYPDLLFGTHYKPIVRKHNKALKLIRDAKGAEDD